MSIATRWRHTNHWTALKIPTEEQIERMNAATALAALLQTHLESGHLDLDLQPNALVLVEVEDGS
jgi:hypothetical protein